MSDEEAVVRLESIFTKLKTIETIIQRHGGVVSALQDFEGQPAILMLMAAISEQFAKLAKQESAILKAFEPADIRGISAVRNFIAHDYDGVNLAIIEVDLRENLPKLGKIVEEILKAHAQNKDETWEK